MNQKVMRIVMGVPLAAGIVLLQGCGTTGKSGGGATTSLPPVDVEAVENTGTTVVAVPEIPQYNVPPLPPVQMSTPYTIQKGDTISSVSYKYGLRWQDVVAVNPGIEPKRLRVGQVIQLPGAVDLGSARSLPTVRTQSAPVKVPAPATTKVAPAGKADFTETYVVKAGDSLSVIAYRHGIKTAELREANGIKGDKILAGQKLKVPATKRAATAATTAPVKATVVTPAVTTPPKQPVVTTPAKVTDAPKVEAAEPPKVEAPAVEVEKAVTPPPTTPVDMGKYQTYTVKENEDLYAVAIRWGVSPSDLKTLNNLNSNDLKPGTVLKIPGGLE